jgi:hypothetical protein
MKKVFILLFLIFSSIAIAQSVRDLDAKNGFRHFKLGSSPAQNRDIKKQIQQVDKNPNISEYVYVGSAIKTIFNVPVSEVRLTFFKNKLYSIQVDLGDMGEDDEFTVTQFQNVLSILEKAYGKQWYQPSNSSGVIMNGAIWDGTKVRLELFRVNFSKSYHNPSDYDHNSGYIQVFDKEMNRQRALSEF